MLTHAHYRFTKKKFFKNNTSMFLVSRKFTPQNVFQNILPWFSYNSQGSWLFDPTNLRVFLFDSLHPLICFYHWIRSPEKQEREIISRVALLLNTRDLSLRAWWPQSPESGMGLVWNSAADALPWIGRLPPASCLWRAFCPCTTYWLHFKLVVRLLVYRCGYIHRFCGSKFPSFCVPSLTAIRLQAWSSSLTWFLLPSVHRK